MKTKKFLILSILTIMVAILFTGCNYNLTTEYESVKKVAKDYLSTKGYEIPKRYSIKYVDEDKLNVTYKNKEMLFDISGDELQIISITDSKGRIINRSQIEECQNIAKDFLNIAGYKMPEETKRIRYSKNKDQLIVTKEYKQNISKYEKSIEITITFDIANDLEVLGIGYWVDELYWIVSAIIIIMFIALGEAAIIMTSSKSNKK